MYKLQPQRAKFEDGYLTPQHKHSYTELTYVIEGRYHQQIENMDITLNKGEICLIGKETPHREYLYQQNAIVLFLGIANSFFDKSMPLETGDPEGQRFLREMILNQNGKYHFVRFVPKKKNLVIPALFESIVSELRQPEPGSWHILMGCVERLLHRLPVDYDAHIQSKTRQMEMKQHFEAIKLYLFLDIIRVQD
jgi:hypothetical protein